MLSPVMLMIPQTYVAPVMLMILQTYAIPSDVNDTTNLCYPQ